jgi:hypothetical protein
LAFSPGSLPSPDPHRSRLRRWAAGLSLLLHLLLLALLLWLPPPSFPGEYAITVRLALVEPSPPEEPLPPPTPKPQVKPAPTPSPSARSVQGSPRPPVGEARAKEGGKAQREGPRLGKSAEGMGVPRERARGVQPSGAERKGEVPGMPKPEAEGTAPAPGVPSVGSEGLAPLAHAAPLGRSEKEERLGPFGGDASPPQSPSASREGLAPLGKAGVGADPLDPSGRGLVGSSSREGLVPRSSGKAGVDADPLDSPARDPVRPDPLGKGQGKAGVGTDPLDSFGRDLAGLDPGRREKLGPLGSDAPLSRNPSSSREGLVPRSLGEAGADADPLGSSRRGPVSGPDLVPRSLAKASVGADPLGASSSSGRGLVGPDPLGKGQGGTSGEEAGACALVVDVSAFPFTPNPSPALLDPEGNVVWPAKDRVQGIPGRVVEESGIALFFRKSQFSEKGYAQVLHVRAIGTRPRAPGSRFHDFALLDREGAERVKEVPPRCQVVFLY